MHVYNQRLSHFSNLIERLIRAFQMIDRQLGFVFVQRESGPSGQITQRLLHVVGEDVDPRPSLVAFQFGPGQEVDLAALVLID